VQFLGAVYNPPVKLFRALLSRLFSLHFVSTFFSLSDCHNHKLVCDPLWPREALASSTPPQQNARCDFHSQSNQRNICITFIHACRQPLILESEYYAALPIEAA